VSWRLKPIPDGQSAVYHRIRRLRSPHGKFSSHRDEARLMTRFGIPAALSSSTRMRVNTTPICATPARLMYLYGGPFDKPALVTTDPSRAEHREQRFAQAAWTNSVSTQKIPEPISAFDLTFLRPALPCKPIR